MAQQRVGKWVNFEIDVSDDAKISDECNLGGSFEYMLLEVPTITSGTLTVQALRASAGTARNLHVTDPVDGGDNVLISASGAGGFMWCVPIHGAQFIKVVSSVNQADDRTFYARGIGQYLILK